MNKIISGCGVLLLTIVASGCSSVQEKRSPASNDSGQCKVQHEGKTINGDDVIICDQLYGALPFVHLTPDNVSNPKDVTLFAALSISSRGAMNLQITDRTGEIYSVVDKNNQSIMDLKKLPKNLTMPENTFFYTIYKITGQIKVSAPTEEKDPYDDTTFWRPTSTIQIATMVPVIELTGCAIDSAMLGTWEGAVSARTASGFQAGKTVPVTITFNQLKKENNLSTYKNKTKFLPDAQVFGIVGQVENMRSVRTDPFSDAPKDATIEFFRVTGMHSPGDSHIGVLYPSGMAGFVPGSEGMTSTSQFGMFSPAGLIQEQKPKPGTAAEHLFDLDFTPHGAHPPSIFIIHMAPEKIGAEKAECPSK